MNGGIYPLPYIRLHRVHRDNITFLTLICSVVCVFVNLPPYYTKRVLALTFPFATDVCLGLLLGVSKHALIWAAVLLPSACRETAVEGRAWDGNKQRRGEEHQLYTEVKQTVVRMLITCVLNFVLLNTADFMTSKFHIIFTVHHDNKS
jgi:hypothetical protein